MCYDDLVRTSDVLLHAVMSSSLALQLSVKAIKRDLLICLVSGGTASLSKAELWWRGLEGYTRSLCRNWKVQLYSAFGL